MKRCEGFVLLAGVAVAAGCVGSEDAAQEPAQRIAQIEQSVSLADRVAACQSDPRVVTRIVTVETCVGADLFLRETFNGNGRACSTCHPVAHNFTIDPGFIAQLPANDP